MVAALLVGLAVASLASGHGQFSGGVGAVLLGYGLAVGASAWALWRRSRFARGPVLSAGLLNVAVAASYVADTPIAWLVLVIAVVTVVGVSLPSTSRALDRVSGRLS